ncbi:hypothetical protein [Deinococcus gobiensis]|uniref:Uncharacterized protein n=1 Tax=Deinococcus gobiensis (strain DSM 21396 / JCM 16679 / CGMCC 1.7299 / I-0) TaxID=745776 RepID=H8H2L8_DEIGI|nr:hypothetical protein [Deinococcus gobiensis]AFD27765.1 hypothetical protein DGo_PB0496 [Deinococcus gobiensis I-0]
MNKIRFAVIDDSYDEAGDIIYILNNYADKYDISFRLYVPNTNEDLSSILKEVESLQYNGIIIDQRLGEYSHITSGGIEIAQKVRNIDKALPIFILTKYIGDESLISLGFSIDDAIEKNQIIEHPEAFLGRLMRSAGRYIAHNKNISDEMNKLIEYSYSRELTEEENKRLIEIKMTFTPYSVIEGAINQESEIDKSIDAKMDAAIELLNRIQNGNK